MWRDKFAGALRSLTIWFNALALAFFPFIDDAVRAIDSALPALTPYLPAATVQHLILLVTIGNIVLRFRTRVPLESK